MKIHLFHNATFALIIVVLSPGDQHLKSNYNVGYV